LLLGASQTGSNSPILGVRANSVPGIGGVGCGPRQEFIMGEHHRALGFNAAVEECAPDVNMTGGRDRLRTLKICKSCNKQLCNCEDRSEQLVVVPPKLAMVVELAGAAQLEVSLKPSKGPAFGSRSRSPKRIRVTPGNVEAPSRGDLLRSGLQVPHPGPLKPRSIQNRLEIGERTLTLKGLGACMVGHAFVASLIFNNQVALTRAWDGPGSVAPCRGSLIEDEFFVIRLHSDEKSLECARDIWKRLWLEISEIQKVLENLIQEEKKVNHSAAVVPGLSTPEIPERVVLSQSRWSVNLVRLYAHEALSVPRFHLDEEGQDTHQDLTSGRILIGAKRAETVIDADPEQIKLDCWARAHYEFTSLADTLVRVPLKANIPDGPTTLFLAGDNESFLVTSNDLILPDGSGACSPSLNSILFPRLPYPLHEAPKQRFVGKICRIPPLASEGRTSIIGGAGAYALPYARINEQWRWECTKNVSLFSDFRSEAVRLFSPTVCPLGLFNGSAPQTEEEAKQLSDAVSSKCDGCGACVDMADYMVAVDIEDIAKANSQERAERAATGSPLRGCLTLKPTMGKTVLMVSTGNSGAETGKEALQRAASEARYAWQNADF
jgi:hypothetical protein